MSTDDRNGAVMSFDQHITLLIAAELRLAFLIARLRAVRKSA